jgi:hypothetical protein
MGKVLAMANVRRTIVAGSWNMGIRTMGAAISTLVTDASSIQGETISCTIIRVMTGARPMVHTHAEGSVSSTLVTGIRDQGLTLIVLDLRRNLDPCRTRRATRLMLSVHLTP